jgi:hypothetical protein
MKIALLRAATGILCLNSLLVGRTASNTNPARLIRFQAPRALSFSDLVRLASVDSPPPELAIRANKMK